MFQKAGFMDLEDPTIDEAVSEGEETIDGELIPADSDVELGQAELQSPGQALVEPDHSPKELVRYDPLRRYLWEIRKYEPLSPEDELYWARRYRKDKSPEAARRLVTTNLKLVVKIAYLYLRVHSNMMDLIQEGNIGLLQAVRKFDPDKGARLPTYASWWIKAYIIKFILDNFRIVKVGTTNDRRKILMNLRKEKLRLEERGIVATPELIAQSLNVSAADVVDVEKSMSGHDLSLDQPLSEEPGPSYLDTLASAEQLIDERLASGELKNLIEEKFREFAATLSPRDRIILKERLIAEEPATLQSIADRYGITREAVRVAEKKLIGKIKDYMKTALKDISEIDFRLGD
jgi:RNA polymerase sigma-32 factor